MFRLRQLAKLGDVVADPQLAVGKYPVMVQDKPNSKGTHMYTYVIAIESVEVREVPEEAD